jgi:hypothetical protein
VHALAEDRVARPAAERLEDDGAVARVDDGAAAAAEERRGGEQELQLHGEVRTAHVGASGRDCTAAGARALTLSKGER